MTRARFPYEIASIEKDGEIISLKIQPHCWPESEENNRLGAVAWHILEPLLRYIETEQFQLDKEKEREAE